MTKAFTADDVYRAYWRGVLDERNRRLVPVDPRGRCPDDLDAPRGMWLGVVLGVVLWAVGLGWLWRVFT